MKHKTMETFYVAKVSNVFFAAFTGFPAQLADLFFSYL
jgi:hypothetical protein